MKTLCVPRIDADTSLTLEEIAGRLEAEGTRVRLDEVPWSEYPYTPIVEVSVGHTGDAIALRYSVREQAVLAEKTVTNSQVSEDSCVELFLSPARDGLYYNFEWSCIGTCLAGVGKERHGRELLPTELIGRVRRGSSLGSQPFGERREETSWSLVAVLPVAVFFRHELSSLGGAVMTGNLYKCGDRLSVPHYVTWNPIDTPAPDYHRPEQFGAVLFEE